METSNLAHCWGFRLWVSAALGVRETLIISPGF
jgi:hypothetical protein